MGGCCSKGDARARVAMPLRPVTRVTRASPGGKRNSAASRGQADSRGPAGARDGLARRDSLQDVSDAGSAASRRDDAAAVDASGGVDTSFVPREVAVPRPIGGNRTGGGVTTRVRQLVSKKKRRFQEGKFDLDLSYVTPQVIAMGFPSSGVEGLYRNPAERVRAFFDDRHPGAFKLYNLCHERSYDPMVFDGSVCVYGFDDHNPPPLAYVRTICEDVHEWVSANPANVAAIHCKAGKGRTGMIICAYLLHAGYATTGPESMALYASMRTLDGKGVTIPSQARYIGYYAEQLRAARSIAAGHPPPAWLEGRSDARFVPTPVRYVRRLRFSHTPRNTTNRSMFFRVFTGASPKRLQFDSRKLKAARKQRGAPHLGVAAYTQPDDTPGGTVLFAGDALDNLRLCGDARIIVYRKKLRGHKKLLQFWVHTAFVEDDVVRLTQLEIDGANKDKKHKKFDADFAIEVTFEPRAHVPSPWDRGSAGEGRTGGGAENAVAGGGATAATGAVDVDNAATGDAGAGSADAGAGAGAGAGSGAGAVASVGSAGFDGMADSDSDEGTVDGGDDDDVYSEDDDNNGEQGGDTDQSVEAANPGGDGAAPLDDVTGGPGSDLAENELERSSGAAEGDDGAAEGPAADGEIGGSAGGGERRVQSTVSVLHRAAAIDEAAAARRGAADAAQLTGAAAMTLSRNPLVDAHSGAARATAAATADGGDEPEGTAGASASDEGAGDEAEWFY